MKRILVVGFPRSGTSLTLRIIKHNPQIKRTFFENFILFDLKNKKLRTKKDFNSKYSSILNDGFAEKIIWEKRRQGKAYVEANVTCLDYCNHWNNLFGEDAKIINVVRHPVDSWNSLIKLRKKQGRMKNIDEQFYEWYCDCAVEFFTEIPKFKNCFVFKYEDLISKPYIVVPKIYKFCDLPIVSFDEKMRSNRAFNHEWFGVRQEIKNYNFEPMIEALNNISGVKYK